MSNHSLYRVLQRDQDLGELLLVELTEGEDGSFTATGGGHVRVNTETDEDEVQNIIGLVSSGHLIVATLRGSEPYEIAKLEHRGGVTFEVLDSWLPPYLILDTWRNRIDVEELRDEGRVVEPIVDDDDVDPLSLPRTIGEMSLVMESASEPSWGEFWDGQGMEPFLREFRELEGEPMEVLAADPVGLPFWCVLAFESEQSPIVRKIRAQYGTHPDEKFVPNPLLTIHDTTGQAEEPTNPDQNPKQVLGENYQEIPRENLPEKAGQGTLALVRELIGMAEGFSMSGFAGFLTAEEDSPTLNDVSTLSPEEYSDTVETIGDAVIGNIKLTMQIYETASSFTDEPAVLVDTGVLPEPELLLRADQIFEQYLALHRGFTRKMESVDIRDYVLDVFESASRQSRREIKKKHPDLGPLPDTLEELVEQQRNTLDIFEVNYKDCRNIVAVESTGTDVQYTEQLNTDDAAAEYAEFKEFREEVRDQSEDLFDADFDRFEGWVDQQMFSRFSSVDASYAKSRCQARFEWFGHPEVDFTSFRTV